MMRRMLWVMGAIAALAVAGSCGSDTKPAPKQDVGTKREATVGQKDTGGTQSDKGLVLPDQSGPKQDKGTTPTTDGASTLGCTPFLAKANTGKICTKDTDCSADEACIENDAGTSAACVGKCCADEKKPADDPANLCLVPDAAKQKSFCFWALKDNTGKQLPYMACAFICSLTISGKTTTYTCPNATDNCVKSQDPDISYCDPK